MKKIKIILIVSLILAAIIGGWIFKIVFISQNGNGQTKESTIRNGSGVNQISRELKQAGLIDSSWVFETYLWLINSEHKIKAGEHQLNGSWSMRRLINNLISGESLANERQITIIEGWDLDDIAAYLEKEGLGKAEDFYNLVGRPAVNHNLNPNLAKPKDFSPDYEFLTEKPKNLSLEGYLFPDTYRIYSNSSLDEIVKKMLDNFDRKITSKMLGDIFSRDKKLYEIITLASIIEKEAKTPEDKKKVAGVYYNRLDLGMALQADPTVNYVTGKSTDRPSLDDIKTDSLYNTYQYPGLPPGPICNPGMDSISAAIYPDKNDYYYFINTPDGEMIFAKTLEEHAQNRAKYFND